MKLKELFVKERKDFFYNAEDEWFFSEENTKKYVLYLLKTKSFLLSQEAFLFYPLFRMSWITERASYISILPSLFTSAPG